MIGWEHPKPPRVSRSPVLACAAALLLAFALPVTPAQAAGAEPEAKQVAAASNCKPGKIEVMRQIPGSTAEIVYKVTCTDYPQMFVLIQCRQRLCSLLR